MKGDILKTLPKESKELQMSHCDRMIEAYQYMKKLIEEHNGPLYASDYGEGVYWKGKRVNE